MGTAHHFLSPGYICRYFGFEQGTQGKRLSLNTQRVFRESQGSCWCFIYIYYRNVCVGELFHIFIIYFPLQLCVESRNFYCYVGQSCAQSYWLLLSVWFYHSTASFLPSYYICLCCCNHEIGEKCKTLPSIFYIPHFIEKEIFIF